MDLIKNNPYRIAGILSNASEKEIQRQKAKINAYVNVGKEINSDLDFRILGRINRTEDAVKKAFSDIEQNQDKVNHALFWFMNASPFDNTAIEYLKNGDEEKAIEIWEKVTSNKMINSNNFSAFNNLGTYKLLGDNKSDVKEGISSKIKLIESEFFERFVLSVADKTFTIDHQKQSELVIDKLINQFKGKYSTPVTMDLFSNCNGSTQQYLSKKFTEAPIHKIETQIEKTKADRIKNRKNSCEYGNKLYKNTKTELTFLKSSLGSANLQYKMLADNVAKEILQCSIDYFNENDKLRSPHDYIEESIQLVRIAEDIAVNNVTKGRIKDSISTLEGMKDRELNNAIAVLRSIKDAYDKACREIDYEVERLKLSMPFNQSINYHKVNAMKENSLNWNKVVELIKESIYATDIVKIKNSTDSPKLKEYQSLIHFLISKLNYSQKKHVEYLVYWNAKFITSSTSSRETKTQQTKSTSQSGSGNWHLWVLGIGAFLGLVIGGFWGLLVGGFLAVILNVIISNIID